MPTLAVGMLEMRESYNMPTASVGMAPFPSTFRNRNYIAEGCAMKKSCLFLCGVFCLAIVVGLDGALPAADEPGDELVQMIVDLVGEKDKEMRAIGLQQVREEAKGPAATKRFAALLPKLTPDAQAALLDALADRGDAAARPAALEMLKSQEEAVRAAATRALASLGEAADVPLLVQLLRAAAGPEKSAAQASLARMQGQCVNAAIVAELKSAKPDARIQLIDVLAARRAKDSVPSILAGSQDADAKVRMASMTALGQLAGPEHAADMLQGVLKAEPGAEREAAEKAVMFACNQTKDADKRAVPLLAAFAKLGEDDRTALLTALGRVGGPDALKVVQAAIADPHVQRSDAGIRALCNWPDASVADQLLDLAQTAKAANHRTSALRALIRVAALPDKRSDAERLDLLKKAMTLATRDDERNLVLKRARAIRTIESLRFAAPYMDKPKFAQEACATVVELAHHRGLREPNKAEFDKALDTVIAASKDADVVDLAKRYKKGQTAPPKVGPTKDP